MPKVNSRYAARVEKAFGFHKKHPMLSVPKLMKLTNFKKNEIEDHAIRMCIYRCTQNWTVIPKEADNPPVTVTCDGDQGVSSVSASLCASTPKVKRIQMTGVYAKQTLHQAYRETQAHYKTAFKHATMVYAREKEKKGGMLAQEVSELINNQFNQVITARTIQRNVKDGKIGCRCQTVSTLTIRTTDKRPC